MEKFKTDVRSEIGKIEGVILHTPGKEIENMTPMNAERALYSDILNRSVAGKEYKQLKGVLEKITKVFSVKDLLSSVLEDEILKANLIKRICHNEKVPEIEDYLNNLSNTTLAKELIEGVTLVKNTYTKFLNEDRYILRPLHNFFFTRDASMAANDKILIGKMASDVREREALIMNEIFKRHKLVETEVVNPLDFKYNSDKIKIEGGDFLVAREDVLLIGNGARTSSEGIDFVIDFLKERKINKHIIIQKLPHNPESFIHLDMVFTFLDTNKCMVFEPVILGSNKLDTIHIEIDNGKVKSICYEDNILSALKKLNFDLEPIFCGGSSDNWIQQREQWHSGANFFALAPGQIIGYGRNVHTINEIHKHGFEVISARDVIEEKICLKDHKKFVVIIDGSELARGGGGCRCMTMPVKRAAVNWTI